MQPLRISPTELRVFAPLKTVREATWHALRRSGVALPLIDVEKNCVAGEVGDGVFSSALFARAQLVEHGGEVSVSFLVAPVIGGTIDWSLRRRAAKMADALERALENQDKAEPALRSAPIASAVGAGDEFTPLGEPIYGQVRSPKRGTTLVVYSIAGLLLCPIIAPFALAYCVSALKDYAREGDPGDSGTVKVAMGLAVFSLFAWGAVVLLSLLL